ncbi:MAG TPA: response regulator [Terriglobales bacterium]|jgi:DNA-binding response OmpR family regulator|nr:response regulator [Terriglobales bacterium]
MISLPMPVSPKSILVVDDDASLRQLITRILQKEGHSVVSCGTGIEGIKLLRESRFDVLLLDLGLPDMDGLSLLQAWHGRNGTKVIVITADDTAETLMTAIRSGAHLYIRKPFEAEQLRDVVTTALKAQESERIEVLSAKPDWLELSVPCSRQAAERMDQFMRQIKIVLPDDEREAVAQAFRELLMNAVEWGGELDPKRRVRISLLRTKRMLQYRVSDPGPGFRLEDLPHAAINNAPGDVFSHDVVRQQKGIRPGGLGLVMVRAVADELLYNEKHNEVIFIKYLDADKDHAEGAAGG